MTDTAIVEEPELANAVRLRLGSVLDPELRKPIVDLGMVGGIAVDDDGHANVEVRLTIVGCPAADRIESDVRRDRKSVV